MTTPRTSSEARTRAVVAPLVAVTALAVSARLAYWLATAARPLQSDAMQYHLIASNLAAGRGLSDTFPAIEVHPTAFRPPLFPLLLGAWYRLTGSRPGAGRLLAVIIGVAVVVAVFFVVRRHVDQRAATVAAALVAIFPPLVANDTITLTEGLSLLLLVGVVHVTIEHQPLFAGFLCGLLTLTRPSAQLFVLVVAALIWRRVGWRGALLTLVTCAAVLVPWLVRNTVQLGEPVMYTSNGFNLAAMYSEEAQLVDGFVDPVYDPAFSDLRLVQFDEVAWDRALRERGLEGISASPGYVAEVLARNALAYFELTPDENLGAERLDGRNLTIRAWGLPVFYVVGTLGAVGLARSRRTEHAQVWIAVAGYFTLASLVFIAAPRLRAPLDLALCVGTGLLAARRPERNTAQPV